MPESRRKSSIADLMAEVPVNRGSLLTSIESLLKTIESSESSVMIPTLLRDKCDFDAWELLFVAKILKASILGHSDLVEFYMNHISHQKKLDAASSPAGASTLRQSTSPALSPATTPTANGGGGGPSSLSGSSSSSSSSSSLASSCSSQTSGGSNNTTATATTSSGWTTATSQQPQHQPQQQQPQPQPPQSARSSLSSATSSTIQQQHENSSGSELVRELARTLSSPSMSLTSRQPQPPSLLQLTTTNNHIINSSRGAIEQQLLSLSTSSSTPVEGPLSISTAPASTNCRTPSTPTTPTSAGIITHHQQHHHELKSSKSAGCLFRGNQSGASSPRLPPGTPTTVSGPQAETLAANGNGQQLALGDPGMPVKLLLQIEQLKSSIAYVTNLLENVVELYRKSIDNIA